MTNPTDTVLNSRIQGAQSQIPAHPRVNSPTVGDLLQPLAAAAYCAGLDTIAREALSLMAQHDLGAVMVVASGRIQGIFSERDYARASARFGSDASAMPVQVLMSSPSFSATAEDPIHTCVIGMHEHRLTFLPVVEGNCPIGLLSIDVLLRELGEYYVRVFKAYELDRQVLFLRGTYSC
jgi:signal-transduction protein with cAMP-binding, CBS, and nucleotidyltransferase domain